MLYGTGIYCVSNLPESSDDSFTFLNFCTRFNFLVGSYVIPVISKPNRGNVTATFAPRAGSLFNLARNFCCGPYASGTFIDWVITPLLFFLTI